VKQLPGLSVGVGEHSRGAGGVHDINIDAPTVRMEGQKKKKK